MAKAKPKKAKKKASPKKKPAATPAPAPEAPPVPEEKPQYIVRKTELFNQDGATLSEREVISGDPGPEFARFAGAHDTEMVYSNIRGAVHLAYQLPDADTPEQAFEQLPFVRQMEESKAKDVFKAQVREHLGKAQLALPQGVQRSQGGKGPILTM